MCLVLEELVELSGGNQRHDVRVVVSYVHLMMVQLLSGHAKVEIGSHSRIGHKACDHRGRNDHRKCVVQGFTEHGQLAQRLFEHLREVILLHKVHVVFARDLELDGVIGRFELSRLGFRVWLFTLPHLKRCGHPVHISDGLLAADFAASNRLLTVCSRIHQLPGGLAALVSVDREVVVEV